MRICAIFSHPHDRRPTAQPPLPPTRSVLLIPVPPQLHAHGGQGLAHFGHKRRQIIAIVYFLLAFFEKNQKKKSEKSEKISEFFKKFQKKKIENFQFGVS
jgi:hypothetical protein